jgi:hypothetical protein
MALSAPAAALCATVQNNCNIADARHATDFTLCVYLLKMREYFRWEMGYSYSANLPKEAVGEWLKAREALWNDLEEADFSKIRIDGHSYDPFDAEAINRSLIPHGYVYSAGLGLKSRPHFFLARLDRRDTFHGHTIFIADDECARDLAAPPAMTQAQTIFVRRESLRRMLWEKVQEWRWNQCQNAMAKALSFYPFDQDLDDALEKMTQHELGTVLEHEIGEVMADEHLGPEWSEMLSRLPRSRAEIVARAARDHLADALSTLPALILRQDAASLHFYAANLTAMRRELFPSFKRVYESWCTDGDYSALKQLVQIASPHWAAAAEHMLLAYRKNAENPATSIERIIAAGKPL